MKGIQETIDYLEKLSGSTDICYACFDNPMCEDCFLNSAIHYLKMFQKEHESVGYDEVQRKEDNDR